MIYTRPHIALIQDGRKTETRRLGRKRWNVGSIHGIRATRFERPVAYVRILSVHADRLGNIDQAGVEGEGYSSLAGYQAAWERIFRQSWNDDTPIWVIRFCVVAGPEKRKQASLFDKEEA